MLHSHQEPILRVELEQISEVKEVSVVVESAASRHVLVRRVDLRYHHVHQHCGHYESDASEEEETHPLASQLPESDCSYSCLDQHLQAGINTRASGRLL